MFWKQSRCKRVRERLSSYIDRRLSSRESEEVSNHLKVCEKCRQELESLEATVYLLHQLPQISTPRSFAVAKPVEGKKSYLPGLPSFGWLRPVAAAVLIALVALLVCDFSGLFLTQKSSTKGETAVTEQPPRVRSLPSEEGKSPEEVSSPAPFAVEKQGIPSEAEATPQGEESEKAGQTKQQGPEASPPPTTSVPFWLRPLEAALASLSGLLLVLFFFTWRKDKL